MVAKEDRGLGQVLVMCSTWLEAISAFGLGKQPSSLFIHTP